MAGPSIEEADLDFSRFRCCGDEDLYLLGCPACNRLMVFCYECDTRYSHLADLSERGVEVNAFDPGRPPFLCPSCGFGFAYFFVRDRLYPATRERWLAAGRGHLLVARDAAPPAWD